MKKLKPLKILEAGGIYRVNDTRKGTFEGKCLKVDETGATFEITKGKARFVSDGGYDVGPGNIVDCRHVLCEYQKL